MSQTAVEDLNTLTDVTAVRTKLEISEKEKSEIESQLRDSQQSVTALQKESRSYLRSYVHYNVEKVPSIS